MPAPLLILTDRHAAQQQGRTLTDTVAAAIDGGAQTIVLREKDLAAKTRIRLATELLQLLSPVQGTLIIASDPQVAEAAGTPWLHLAAADPTPQGSHFHWGRSCHNAKEVKTARAEGAAYITISPVFPSASKPGYGPVLGIHGIKELTQIAGNSPTYGLGGVSTEQHISSCLNAGLSGVAVMGAIMGAVNPRQQTAALNSLLLTLTATQTATGNSSNPQSRQQPESSTPRQ